MTTALVNSEINTFSEKLMIYNRNFFSVINAPEGLLSETTSIKEFVKLDIPASKTDSNYSIDQFGKFIKKIVNFNIKNYPQLAVAESDLCFVNRSVSGVLAYQANIKDTVISTLKVLNVFVDILEAYKYCIDNEQATLFDSGYRVDRDIDEIHLVSDKARYYQTAGTAASILPKAEYRNAGFIRKVTISSVEKTVLFISIQSFKTGMLTDKYKYDDIFDEITGTTHATSTSFLDNTSITAPTTAVTPSNYIKQVINTVDFSGNTTKITLEARDKALVKLFVKMLLNLDKTNRKQSVYALYYYYKFVQLYSTLIINISNVMYNDVKLTSATTASAFRIDTFNTATNIKTHGISAVEYIMSSSATTITVDKNISGISITPVGGTPSTAATLTAAGAITRGKGYVQNPTIGVTQSSSTAATTVSANATIVPMVYETTTMSNDDNIKRLETVITEINDTITRQLDDLATYNQLSSNIAITSATSNVTSTKVYSSSDNNVVIVVKDQNKINSLNVINDKYDLVSNCIIYDSINKYSYEILEITNSLDTEFEIKIKAVFLESEIPHDDQSMKVFRKNNDAPFGANPGIKTNAADISHSSSFLELKMKDTISYKDTYIETRNEISGLDEDIGYRTNKVAHQNNLYETQNNKKVFIERQVFAYNIILAIILLILVGINVVKVDKQIVKTVSLSCLGVIILLFVIYFISNMTYVETFANSSDLLFALSYDGFVATTGEGSNSDTATYTTKKVAKLNNEIKKLNARFISYFEKLIITLPASENFEFYKEISEVIKNDKENKEFTKKRLDYSTSQNNNNINSIKYEVENSKLYLNTILISAIIFVGLYNMYINYLTDDKYLSLMIFVCLIIFIIILSYYYITANRRVKTVFKSIYWGPEFSKRF